MRQQVSPSYERRVVQKFPKKVSPRSRWIEEALTQSPENLNVWAGIMNNTILASFRRRYYSWDCTCY